MKNNSNWFQRGLLGAVMLLLSVSIAFAQDVTINGTVTGAEDGMPIPGVSVVEKGTTNGTITDIDGKYSLTVPQGAVIAFTFVGMKGQEFTVGTQTTINVSLQSDAVDVDEVVVTALGIKKKEKSLTYSTQQLGGEELTRSKDANLVNALAGKTAGVQINKNSSGVGGSTKVTIRGSRSIGNNQPLYVIDGIPMLNSISEAPATAFGGSNDAGGRDAGDGISNLNPDDIKSINILKGPAAAALYGTQAANGVIVITTKQGVKGRSSVTFSSNTTFESVMMLPELQNEYGTKGITSWGDKGNLNAYDPKDFFQTGVTSINSLSISSGGEKMQTYFSYANTTSKGTIEDSGLDKHNLNVRATTKLFNDKVSVDGNINIIKQKVENRPVSGGYYFNPLVGLYRFPRGNNLREYQNDFEVYNVDRNLKEQNWHNIQAEEQNPWWLTKRIQSDDERMRAITNLTIKWDVSPALNVQVRGSYDVINDKYNHRTYATTHTALSGANGRYIVFDSQQELKYGDVLANYNQTFGDISLTASIGASINDSKTKSSRLDSRPKDLYYANVFNVANMKVGYVEEVNSQRQMQSVFGTAQIGYKDALFLDITGRNDWSSTLAYTSSLSSGFFYPSVGLTAVLSDMIDMPDFINLGKVRGAWSKVGNDIPMYISNPLNTQGVDGNVVINSYEPFDNLKPELTRSFEIGTEWTFVNNRVKFDFTYYKTNTENQLFTLDAPAGSGYSFYYVNAGEIQNQGVEIMLGLTPVAHNDFYWKSDFNFAMNKNEVIELHPDLPFFSFGDPGNANYWMRMDEGGSYGDIYGVKFKRDASGKIEVDDEGLPVAGSDYEKIANINPDFNLGWNNTINYKNLTFSFLIDGRFGGDVVSMTQADLDQYGVTQVTADARNKGYVEVDGQKFTNVEGFYSAIGGRQGVTEQYVYDATNIRLREMSLGFNVPTSLLEKTKLFKGATISAVGRNLFFIYNSAPFDPDALYSTGNNLQGVDIFGMPATRSIGFNVKLNF